VNEPDMIHGINHILGVHSRLRLYEHEGNWTKAIGWHLFLPSSAFVESSHMFRCLG
jgi:hypothetical protein